MAFLRVMLEEENLLQAIETAYKGYRFRSRTEARWAVFFDELQITFEYEKEGYDLSEAGWYLPDFWLSEQKCWVEVKGQIPNESERAKAKALARYGRRPVWILVGSANFDDDLEEMHTYYRVVAEKYFFLDLPEWYEHTVLSDPDEYGGIEHVKRNIKQGGIDSRTANPLPFSDVSEGDDEHLLVCSKAKFFSAYSAARGARFEHGVAR